LLEGALGGRNLGCRPGVDARQMLVGAGGRLLNNLRASTDTRDLCRRQQIGRLAQVLGVVCDSLQSLTPPLGKMFSGIPR